MSIILTTANARYSHSSLGLRYLSANMDHLKDQTILIEHTINDTPEKLVADWIGHTPKIIGIGIYIWNLDLLTNAIQLLKKENPEIIIIIGGPEVSYGISDELFKTVDYIIQLEGEVEFKNLCQQVLDGFFPTEKVIKSKVLDIQTLKLPYELYSEQDIKYRKIYVEASRGCAFKCHFCLSSLDDGIRNFDIIEFLSEMKILYQKGVRQFKFVDRTFNLDVSLSVSILTFFLELDQKQDYFLHFEVIPDRLPIQLKKHIEMFKPGVLQFEVGIQTLDKEVSDRIGRRQNKKKALENLSYLRNETNAHLHVDLIIGLPGATLEIFKSDLNQLISLGLQEVQVGILKNLKGTPLAQHIGPFEMIFSSLVPYEIKSNLDLNTHLMNQLFIFHKFWDKYYNSGNFIKSMKALFQFSNPFDEFFAFSEFAFQQFSRHHSLSLDQLAEALHKYFQEKKEMSYQDSRALVLQDILIKKDRKIPKCLKDYELGIPEVEQKDSLKSLTRQSNNESQ
jgi:radical SAM superfamily enzyme YgiQ (UPF0313 family)